MKRVFEFDDVCAVEIALGNLRRYNHAMYISLDEEHIDKDVAEKYFRAKEGSEEKIQLRKQIRAAAIMSCNDNPDIPEKYKHKVGDRMSREFVSAMDAAAVDFQYYSGEFGMLNTPKAEAEREKRHKEIAIVRKTHYLDKVTKQVRKSSITVGTKEGISFVVKEVVNESPDVVRWSTRAIMFATKLIPESVKEATKQTAKKAFEKAGNIIDKNIERFEKTSFGSKVKNVIETKVAPVIQKGYEKVSDLASSAKRGLKKIWTGAKSIFA